jgi:nitrite reductase/ring-hydroxylating ferredoxin subunit
LEAGKGDFMRVVHLAGEGDNYIEMGDERYLVLQDASLGCHTVSATCSHRGGPLHLGQVDETRRFIVCPWHKNRTSIERLLTNGLPTVRSRGRVTVVFGEEATGVPHTYRRSMLIDCPAALAQGGRTR